MAAQLEETPADLLDSLGSNPLPDSYMITVGDADDVSDIAEKVETLTGISEAQYGEDTVDNMFTMLKWIRYFGIGLIALLIIASIVIVAFNIKITVASRKWEIVIMRYVGASNWYIRWPFCIAGMVMGLIGGIVAVGLLYGAYSIVIERLSSVLVFMNLVSFNMYFLYMFLVMIAFGIFLGSTGSLLSLNVYLKERKKMQ
jgi:cell division transport system permease protein